MESPRIVLSDDDKRLLLAAARAAIVAGLHDCPATRPAALPPHLLLPGAVFVSLHIGDALRGCIGSITATFPLIDDVIDNANKAAFEDPRFPPLKADELERLTLEISYLTEPVRVSSVEQIVLGVHGIVMENGVHRAVFLPQVPVEYGWTREETLAYLARKAGLSADAWRDRATRFSVFETISFSADK